MDETDRNGRLGYADRHFLDPLRVTPCLVRGAYGAATRDAAGSAFRFKAGGRRAPSYRPTRQGFNVLRISAGSASGDTR